MAVPFRSILLLQKKTTRSSRNGNPFINIQVGDSSGSFNANAFDNTPAYEVLNTANEGCILRISGKTEYYPKENGQFSPKLDAVEVITKEEAEVKEPSKI